MITTKLRRLIAFTLIFVEPCSACAHGNAYLIRQAAWSGWNFTPDIVVPTAVVALIYLAGMGRRQAIAAPARWRRHAAFLSGLVTILLALESPIDFLAERLFFVHQIQHVLLMLIAPVLLMGSAPEPVLIMGLPHGVRRKVLAPIVTNRIVRGFFAFLTHPVTATLLCGGALSFWMIPADFDAALADETIHYCMHVSMFICGLIFWWRLLDRRAPPVGSHYLTRAAMLELMLMMIALLGGYLTSKNYVLYRSNDPFDLIDIATLTDEQLGGLVLWLAGGAIMLIALLRLLRFWVQEQTSVPSIMG